MHSPCETDLRRALETDEIVPHFQPVADLQTGHLRAFEVLARWRHPTRGLIAPDRFIPLAENQGLIGELSGHILGQAFTAASTLPENLRLAVNISPMQLRDHTLPAQLESCAQRTGFSLRRLTVEITESILVGNLKLARQVGEELRAIGVRLALDDFGTGYSSLRQLQALPFDVIKIDRSFVRSIADGRESRKIAAAIVGLGHSLGLVTVGEGIEEKRQAEILFYLGCELGQGWFYGRPVPADRLAAMVSERAAAPEPRPDTFVLATEIAANLEARPTQRLAQLQAIYDGAPVGLCFLDKDLRYVSMNRRLVEMSNAPGDPRLGRTIQQVVPEVFEQIEPYLRRSLAGEAIRDIEIRTARVDAPGKFNTLLGSLQPVRDEAGEVVGVSIAVVDITERKQVEQALRESEEHYRYTVELSPQVPWTADPDGKILDVGPRWEEMTGIRKSETLGEGWRRALHPEDLLYTDKAWRRALETGNPVDVEYRIGRGNGIWRWVRARAASRRGPNGEIIRWYGTVEDIDDRKRAEEALRESEARLRAILETQPAAAHER